MMLEVKIITCIIIERETIDNVKMIYNTQLYYEKTEYTPPVYACLHRRREGGASPREPPFSCAHVGVSPHSLSAGVRMSTPTVYTPLSLFNFN